MTNLSTNERGLLPVGSPSSVTPEISNPTPNQNPTPHWGPQPENHNFLGSRGCSMGYRAIEMCERLGFEGLRSQNGGEIDPPMWGTVLILVPYPTTLHFSV